MVLRGFATISYTMVFRHGVGTVVGWLEGVMIYIIGENTLYSMLQHAAFEGF